MNTLCACGCGKPVTPDDRGRPRRYLRNHHFISIKLYLESSHRLSAQNKEWKASGKLDEIRRKSGNAKGMPDHLAAKQWTIRDPKGVTHSFSNLNEWARQHESWFDDCAPASKLPHWRRISGGIGDLLNAKGSCSYRGWVGVSKTELAEGAPDLLSRVQPHNKNNECPAI